MSLAEDFLEQQDRTIPDLQALIVEAIDNHPRNLQVELGPSDIANDCDRCLVEELGRMHARRVHGELQTSINDGGSPWLPAVGRAMHEYLERLVNADNRTGRYLTEWRVLVGTVGGEDIYGSADVFDLDTGTVVDYKLVGHTTLKDFRAHGCKWSYRRQVQLYGLGFDLLGFRVDSVAVWCLPRNGWTIGAGFLHQEPYDRTFALLTMQRAQAFYRAIEMFGCSVVLAATPAHTYLEFSCPRPPSEKAEAFFSDITG